MFKKKFPFARQLESKDCGAACMKMIIAHYEKKISIQSIREQLYVGNQGVSMLGISEYAERIGMRSLSAQVSYEMLEKEASLPCIVHWNQNHFVVVYRIKKNKVYIADPALGLLEYSKNEFCKFWLGSSENSKEEGILLLLEPSPDFYKDNLSEKADKTNFLFLIKYLIPHKNLLFQLALGLLAGSLLSLFVPFLTQSLIDVGVNNQDIGFVYIILIAQVMFFLGRTYVNVIRSWIMLHMSTRISISIISDFLTKLMKLPISFFDARNLGDIMQRIRDHDRIKQFITSTSLETVFSVFNLIVLSVVLLHYNTEIYLIFLAGSILYVLWITIFLARRKKIDYKRFHQSAATQSNEVHIIQGMQEIKLNNSEKLKRWEWENIQIKLFKISMGSLSLDQVQNTGGAFIDELKNILITFWAATEVIDGNMTLGMMMASQQILGQLNSPIRQLAGFIQNAQDAKISLERLGEIHNQDDEDQNISATKNILEGNDIVVKNLSFRYGSAGSELVLDNISLTIPQGKTTAIVGASGGGKTTLLKLLLKFYENIDTNKLAHATDVANIGDYINALPQQYDTKIGGDGLGLSQGQKQRILIARAVYKNPEYLFFDEATSSLDAKNEKEITEKLIKFSRGKTLIVIAHRLSTVKNADQILFIDDGKIKETGNHHDLTAKKGLYFQLVKNQLELGN